MNQPIPRDKCKTLPGACPIDGAKTRWIRVADSDPDHSLLSGAFPFVVQVCPACLTAASDHTFLSGGTQGIGAVLRSPHSNMRRLFARSLGVRLRLVKDHWAAMSREEREQLLGSRAGALSETISAFLSEAVPGLDEKGASALVNHFLVLFAENPDPGDMFSQFTMRTRYSETVKKESPAARLIREGADINDVCQSLLFGTLVSGFTVETLAGFESDRRKNVQGWFKLSMLHLELDRIANCLMFIGQKAVAATGLAEELESRDPWRLVRSVEQTMEQEYNRKTQSGYFCLALGRNYHKEYMLCRSMRGSAAQAAELEHFMLKAIKFFELSLRSEKYPAFEAGDSPPSLHEKARVRVPYLFGEFGVRHALCCLYNDLGRMRALSENRDERAIREISHRITELWTANHGKFKELDFGSAKDPLPVQWIIPRMISFCSSCFDENAGQELKKMVLNNRERLYGRYMNRV